MTADAGAKRLKIYTQEAQIAALEKMIVGTGHDLLLSDKAKDLKITVQGIP